MKKRLVTSMLLFHALLLGAAAFAQSTPSPFPRAAVTFLDGELPAMEVAVQNNDRNFFDTALPRVRKFLADWDMKSDTKNLDAFPACTDAVTDFLIVGLCRISAPGTVCEPETFIPKFNGNVEQCRSAAMAAEAQEITPLDGAGPLTKMVLVGIHDAARNDVQEGLAPAALFASFPLIQGSLVGRPSTKPILHIPITFGAFASLPMDKLAALIEPLATTASEEMRAIGLSVAPATARLARVGTFFTATVEEKYTFGAGFLDTQTRDWIALAYFSEKCRVQGVLFEGKMVIEVDLDIPAPGLHWVRYATAGPNRQRAELASGETAISLVTPELRR